MKAKQIFNIFAVLLLAVTSVMAQESNHLYIPDIIVEGGKQFQLPIYVQNTNSDITALQFTINLPSSVDASSWSQGSTTDRTSNHKVVASSRGDSVWTVMLYSTDNKKIRANSGVVFYLPTTISEIVPEGSELTMELSRAVLSDSLGHNVLTNYDCGKITICKTPDFIVTDVSCDKQQVNPEDTINISWNVKNIGSIVSTGGWSERIYLLSDAGEETLLTTTYYNDTNLNEGEEINRSVNVGLKRLLGVDGKGNIKVQLIPNSDAGESAINRSNNIGESPLNSITIGHRLYISLYPYSIGEPRENNTITVVVERSGSTGQILPLSLQTIDDDRLHLPERIAISQGNSSESFHIIISGDDLINDISDFIITVSADGYDSVNQNFTIVDDEMPNLSLKASKSEIHEGGDILFTITNQRVTKSDLTISLTCDYPNKFSFPSTVTMLAGSNTVNFEVSSIEDVEATDTLAVCFTASAINHYKGEAILFLVDNDMPEIDLELKPTIISEGDGLSAIVGTVIRRNKVDNQLTIVLSDDSNGHLKYSKEKIILLPGETTAEFTMVAIDNANVDGNHQYNVSAAVYINTCNCSANGSSKGSVTRQITVNDDDGPTLKVKPSVATFQEGKTGEIIVSHNVNTDRDVWVTITSDFDEGLEYEHHIVIPAGQSSIQVQVKVKGNDIAEDSRVVAFTVASSDFAIGSCWVNITDKTLPDATIKQIYVTPNELIVNSAATIHVTICNTGNAPLPPQTRINLYCDESSSTFSNLYTYEPLPVGSETTLETTLRLPDITGSHFVTAVINEDKSVKELMYTNNTSDVLELSIQPSFTATAHTDKSIYKQGETVKICGVVSGKNVANTNVEVYIVNAGNRQTIIASTDATGNYAVNYTPMTNQTGHFILGACYPKEGLTTEMSSFDVYGIIIGGSPVKCEFDIDQTYTGTLSISNANNFLQTGLHVTQSGTSDNCEFSFSIPQQIEAGKTVDLAYSIKPSAVSEGTVWQQMPITIMTNEGATANYTIKYYVHSLKALLQSDVTNINTTMTKNATRDYPITITNIGKGETGSITLSLPEWMTTSTPSEIASLAQGEQTTIHLRFMPTEDMALNVPVLGHLGINCQNGSGVSVDFSITPVSDYNGTLTVDVTDEFTYYTEEAPHVADAQVDVKLPVTGELVATGKSDDSGRFSVNLPEGQYKIEVKASKHDDYCKVVMVNPGRETNNEVFLSYQAVTYTWNVQKTEIEDEYIITTVANYDVRVPKPHFEITLPDERPTVNSVMPIIITNKGIIDIINVKIALSVNLDCDIEYLTSPEVAKLAPQQSEIFYVKLLSRQSSQNIRSRLPGASCTTASAQVVGDYLCSDYQHLVSDMQKQWGACGGNGGGNGGGYVGGFWGYNNYPLWHIDYGPNIFYPDTYGNEWSQNDIINETVSRVCNSRPEDDPENDPDNPNHPENDPNNLPDLVPNIEPSTQPCNDERHPVFVYKIVPISGTRYELKGVAADGLSRVKLVLDPEQSRVPENECINFSNFHWELSQNLGTIEGDGYKEAIYTAPEVYPNEWGSSIFVEATMWYTMRVSNDASIDMFSKPVKIEIIRPPVVFVHGLGSSQACWQTLDSALVQSGLYKDNINYRMDYSRTNTSRFDVNYKKVGNAIKRAQRRAFCQGYIATKCDLVGHSMGGTLSRLYVQLGGDRNGVNRKLVMR